MRFFLFFSGIPFEEAGWFDPVQKHMQVTKINGGFSYRAFGQIELALFEALAPNSIAVTLPAEDLDQFAPPAEKYKIVSGGWRLSQQIDGGSRQPVERFAHILGLLADIDS